MRADDAGASPATNLGQPRPEPPEDCALWLAPALGRRSRSNRLQITRLVPPSSTAPAGARDLGDLEGVNTRRGREPFAGPRANSLIAKPVRVRAASGRRTIVDRSPLPLPDNRGPPRPAKKQKKKKNNTAKLASPGRFDFPTLNWPRPESVLVEKNRLLTLHECPRRQAAGSGSAEDPEFERVRPRSHPRSAVGSIPSCGRGSRENKDRRPSPHGRSAAEERKTRRADIRLSRNGPRARHPGCAALLFSSKNLQDGSAPRRARASLLTPLDRNSRAARAAALPSLWPTLLARCARTFNSAASDSSLRNAAGVARTTDLPGYEFRPTL